MVDPVERSDELDRQILAIPADRVFTKRSVVVGFLVLMVPLLLILGQLRSIAGDTNKAVNDQVVVLQDRNTELETKVAQLEDVAGQATDWIVRLVEQIQALGGEPPLIEIRPTTTTTEPGG